MKLQDRQKILKILSKREPKLAEKLIAVQDILALDHNIRDQIASVLCDEFSEKGLQKDDEPNKYGLEIEHLIGECKLAVDE